MHTNERKRFGACLAALSAVLIFATGAFAQTLSLLAPSLANVDGALKARFGVTVEDLPILKGELEDGAELELKCEVGLYHVRDYWLDGTMGSTTFTSVLKFEPLTKEFVMTLPGREKPLRGTDLTQLVKDGWSEIEASLGTWDMLERGEHYSLRLDTGMNEKDAPSGITRFIYFWSWDAGASNAFQLDFTY